MTEFKEDDKMNKEKFDKIVDIFNNTRDSEDNLVNMHYLLIKDNDNCFVHRFNGRTEKSDIRSISKTVMTLVVGIVNRLSLKSKYPLFDEETYIYPIIEGVVNLENKENKKYLEKVQVKHLLTHSVGFDKVLLMRDDIKDMDPYKYVDYIINYPIVHEPGEYYLYSNAGIYLLSVVLQEFLKEDLLEFIKRELFKPLDIQDFEWEKYGNYLAGATRLWLYPEDLLKIGELMLNKGTYDDKRIVPENWIEKMRKLYFKTEDVDTPGAIFRRYGYGLGIWLPKEDFYFGHGTDGQILTVLPEHNFIVITQSYQHDIKPIEKIVDSIVRDKLGLKN